jgi:hypothetical protein
MHVPVDSALTISAMSALYICCERFFKNNDSATETQCEFRKHFNTGRNGKFLTRHTILNWV